MKKDKRKECISWYEIRNFYSIGSISEKKYIFGLIIDEVFLINNSSNLTMEIIAIMKHSLLCLIYIIKYLIHNVKYLSIAK